MNDIARCLRQIDKVKEVAEGETTPYAARSRIARLTLDATRLVCSALGHACAGPSFRHYRSP